MDTPSPEPPIRRTTRSALMEIPARMGALALSVPTDYGTPGRNQLVNNHLNVMNGTLTGGLLIETNLPGSYMTPSPSPDELVIQRRGRRKGPVTWSPDIDSRPLREHPANEQTPVKSSRTGIVLRSTPRKRLLMTDPLELSPSPKKDRVMSPAKKIKLDGPGPTLYGSLETALRAFSNPQLIGVIKNLITLHPYLEQEIKNNLPAPDLKPLEERLHDLKRNIFKSLPNSRLTSKTDSLAYNRASTHVLAFKKCVQEQGKLLVESEQWETVCEFVVMAWKYVSGTPLWDNPPHNLPRKQCFKHLAANCLTALTNASFSIHQCNAFYAKLESFAGDSEDIVSCLKQLDTMKKRLLAA